MINIAIVEDDVGAAEELKQLLTDFLSKKECAFEIRHFPTADRFLFDYHHEYDLVFLDIEMPGTNGMDAAREIRKTDQTVSIVFVTNMAHFATAGYSVNASDYILKPINRYEFNMKMVRIFNRLCRSDGDFVLVQEQGRLVRLSVPRIRYIEVQGHYVVFHTADGDFTEYATLKSIEKRLGREALFVRCNYSYLVNLQYVTAVDAGVVYIGEEELPIGRSKKKGFYAAFAAYIAGKTQADV